MKRSYFKAKGSNAERELMLKLWNNGFAVLRAAGSGVNQLPCPDVIAINKKKKIAFECKAWNSKHLSIDVKQMDQMLEWAVKADAEMYIAWKIPQKGWLFLQVKDFNKHANTYTISLKNAAKSTTKLEILAGLQSTLGSSFNFSIPEEEIDNSPDIVTDE